MHEEVAAGRPEPPFAQALPPAAAHGARQSSAEPSPLALDDAATRAYWVARTDYAWPGVAHFESVPHLLQLAAAEDLPARLEGMRRAMAAKHAEDVAAAEEFWRRALALLLASKPEV